MGESLLKQKRRGTSAERVSGPGLERVLPGQEKGREDG